MTTQNATSISRKRSSPAVSCPDLQKLRIQTWYKHLLERAVEDEVTLEMVPVSFDIVKPGESLIEVETETSTA